MLYHIGGQLGTKVVISALGMLALYMRFNGTGIWGGETIYLLLSDSYQRQICDFPFLSTSLLSPEAIYDALCSVIRGLINPNMVANDL